MCRRNQIPAAGLIGFGAGALFGLLFDSVLVHLLVGAAAISVGIWLLQGKCHA